MILKTVCTSCLLTMATIVVAAQTNTVGGNYSGWEIITVQNYPEAREDCGFVEVEGTLYLLGGRGIKPVEGFNTVTHAWDKLTFTPFEMHHFQAIQYNNEIWVVGGMTGGFPHEKPLENIYIYNPEKNEWRKGPEIPESRRRGSGGTVVYKNKIYFACGIQDGHYEGTVNWLDVYDLKKNKWDTLSPAPHGRDHFNAAVVDDKLYLAGGRRTSLKTKQIGELTVSEVDVYDFKTKQWSTVPDKLPTPRAGTTAASYRGRLIVIGGESVDQKNSHNEVEALDTKTGRWSKLPSLVTGRHDTQAALYKKTIYIAAGSAAQGGGPDQKTIESWKLKK